MKAIKNILGSLLIVIGILSLLLGLRIGMQKHVVHYQAQVIGDVTAHEQTWVDDVAKLLDSLEKLLSKLLAAPPDYFYAIIGVACVVVGMLLLMWKVGP